MLPTRNPGALASADNIFCATSWQVAGGRPAGGAADSAAVAPSKVSRVPKIGYDVLLHRRHLTNNARGEEDGLSGGKARGPVGCARWPPTHACDTAPCPLRTHYPVASRESLSSLCSLDQRRDPLPRQPPSFTD